MAFTDLFSARSSTYAEARPTYPEELYAFIAAAAPANERVWDCATGSGQAAIGLARHFRAVEATDASEQQIAHARHVANVRYSVQPAEKTDFAAASFDAVCVAQALHWFDLERFYSEVRRVLKPRGVIAAWGYDWMAVTPEIDEMLRAGLLAALKPHWPKQNELLWTGYRHVPFPFEPIEVPPMRIVMRWSFEHLMRYVETWTATRQCIEKEGRGFLDRTAQTLRGPWGALDREVSMSLHVRIGRTS